MKQSKTTKIVAFFALFGIIVSIVGTGVLVFYEMYFSSNKNEISLTQEQLQELINSYSGTTSSGTTSSGELIEDNIKNNN